MPRHGDLVFTRVSHSFVRPVAQVELQEDSQEFKGILFEALFGDDVQSLSEPARDALKAPFEGQLINQIECPDVEFTKSWTEPFLELALDVRGAKGNIEQSLDR